VIELNFPKYKFRFKKDSKNRPCIFDAIRKKWLVYTPEEWVRQHWLVFLTETLSFPEGMIQIESGLKVNHNQRRSDVLIYKGSQPKVLIECKAPEIKVSEQTLSQALNYNTVYSAEYIVLSNGLSHYVFRIKKDGWEQLSELPPYQDL
jgi:hypothetical protein